MTSSRALEADASSQLAHADGRTILEQSSMSPVEDDEFQQKRGRRSRRDETKLKSSFSTQAKALFRKNALAQRRSMWQNIFMILTPVFFVVLLFVLQKLIDSAISGDENNKCGCLCLRCCSSPSDGSEPICRDATAENPCNPWEDCKAYDENECGVQYSNADQADRCEISSPSIWPPLFQVPEREYLAQPWAPKAAMLMTGDDLLITDQMRLFPQPNTTTAEINASRAFANLGMENNNAVYTSTPLMGLQMGTTQKYPNLAYYIEASFIVDPPDVSSISICVSMFCKYCLFYSRKHSNVCLFDCRQSFVGLLDAMSLSTRSCGNELLITKNGRFMLFLAVQWHNVSFDSRP